MSIRNVRRAFFFTVSLSIASLVIQVSGLHAQEGFGGFTYDNYSATAKNIYLNFNQMATTANPLTSGMQLSRPGSAAGEWRVDTVTGRRQVKMNYSFGHGDLQFGVGGSHELLDSTSYSGNQNLYSVKSNWVADGVVMEGSQGFGNPSGSGTGFNSTNTPWLTKAGATKQDDALFKYMDARRDQWSLDYGATSDNQLNPFRRAAAALGMSYNPNQIDDFPSGATGDNPNKYSNNYVVTMWIDEKAFFRPNAFQSVEQTDAASAPFVPDGQAGEAGWEPDPTWQQDWEADLIGGQFKEDGSQYDSYSDFYKDWWGDNDPKGNFPWTGIGFTYDWYYQNADNEEWDAYWSEVGPDGHFLGEGLAEYVMLQGLGGQQDGSGYFEIIDVQTTYNYLGGTNGNG
ncbi:MAG: hypothetical protein P8J33_18240, partial [Pirellulaceae bacterium]|nr:hypothetical protein [Pirellulaceae bacterium]